LNRKLAKMASEPKVPNCIRASGILWVPAAAPRQAPEELLLELMRSVFFGSEEVPTAAPAQRLRPASDGLSAAEAAAVRAFRGRQKKEATSTARVEHYYAPAYPQLARTSWLRAKDARVVVEFLFRAVLGGHLATYSSPDEQAGTREDLAASTVRALLGDTVRDGHGGREIFADAVEKAAVSQAKGIEILEGFLGQDRYSESRKIGDPRYDGQHRTFAGCEFVEAAFDDWYSLVKLERSLSRHHWLALVSCYLRLVVPMAALVQSRGVVMLDRWLRSALRGEIIPTQEEIEESFVRRARGLIQPTQELCRDHLDAIAEYMRARVRVSALLQDLRGANVLTNEHLETTLVAKRVAGPGEMRIVDLLARVAAKRTSYARVVQAEMEIGNVGDFVERRAARLCEQYTAWRRPLDVGPGKLLKWLMYPLYCIGQFDERGSHLMVQPRRELLFTIQPGPLVLQFMTLMRAIQMSRGASRAPVLRDVEEHFRAYGVEFAARPEGRTLLVSQMQHIGLLVGSADAGESARIRNPYQSIVRRLSDAGELP
jgi:hypothetical protein